MNLEQGCSMSGSEEYSRRSGENIIWKAAPLICILCFNSCSRQTGPRYFPLSNGAQYEYSIELAAPLLGVQKGKMRSRVDSIEKIGANEYFKVVQVVSGIPGVEPETNYIRKTDRGIYAINGKHKDSAEYLAYPFPLSVGSQWLVNAPQGQSECKVESEETAELWTRRYENALKVNCSGLYDGKPYTSSDYIARDVGTVKSTVKVGGVTMESNLENYRK